MSTLREGYVFCSRMRCDEIVWAETVRCRDGEYFCESCWENVVAAEMGDLFTIIIDEFPEISEAIARQ